MAGFLSFLSLAFGWIYTLAWSASFYPQPLLNYHRRSTSGTTVDFPLLNVLGFAAYFISNLCFYSSRAVRDQYAERHHGLTPTVQLNDIVFALHALIVSVITTSQYLLTPLWGFQPSAGNRPSRTILGVCVGSLLGVLGTYTFAAAAANLTNKGGPGGVDPKTDWCAIDVVYAVGYVKLLVTLIKYAPQIAANWRNRSTKGWSIWQILLDLCGGVLSVAQQGIDSWLQGDWSGITGNPVKFALGNCSMLYDAVFIAQHYVIYRGDDDDEARRRRRRGDAEQGRPGADGDRRLD